MDPPCFVAECCQSTRSPRAPGARGAKAKRNGEDSGMMSGAGCAIQCGDMKWNWILPMFDGELRNLQAKFSLS